MVQYPLLNLWYYHTTMSQLPLISFGIVSRTILATLGFDSLVDCTCFVGFPPRVVWVVRGLGEVVRAERFYNGGSNGMSKGSSGGSFALVEGNTKLFKRK